MLRIGDALYTNTYLLHNNGGKSEYKYEQVFPSLVSEYPLIIIIIIIKHLHITSLLKTAKDRD